MAGGGNLDILGYNALFNQLASYGFVVAAPKSCNEGCTKPGGPSKYTACAGLPGVAPSGLIVFSSHCSAAVVLALSTRLWVLFVFSHSQDSSPP
jgi:hypothetical protein